MAEWSRAPFEVASTKQQLDRGCEMGETWRVWLAVLSLVVLWVLYGFKKTALFVGVLLIAYGLLRVLLGAVVALSRAGWFEMSVRGVRANYITWGAVMMLLVVLLGLNVAWLLFKLWRGILGLEQYV